MLRLAGIIVGGLVLAQISAPFAAAAPPDTSLTGPRVTSDRTPLLQVEASKPAARLECSVDGGEFEPCSTRFETPALKDGRHVVTARAISPSGKADPTPARHGFYVDTRRPRISISGLPAGDRCARGAVRVRLKVRDPGPSGPVRLELGGRKLKPESPGRYVFSLKPERKGPGHQWIQLTVRDKAGNLLQRRLSFRRC